MEDVEQWVDVRGQGHAPIAQHQPRQVAERRACLQTSLEGELHNQHHDHVKVFKQSKLNS